MTILLAQPGQDAVIPEWVNDLDSFRQWASSDRFPESGQYAHLKGSLWVDGSMESRKHNDIKTEFTIVIGALVKARNSGKIHADGLLLTNVYADLSTEPDVMYISYATRESGKVVYVKGPQALEALGTPDMVLEVVSPTSRHKDRVTLLELYHRAGIQEYWLIEPAEYEEKVGFTIFRHTPDKYIPIPVTDGWTESAVFQKSFRLTPGVDPLGETTYQLEVR